MEPHPLRSTPDIETILLPNFRIKIFYFILIQFNKNLIQDKEKKLKCEQGLPIAQNLPTTKIEERNPKIGESSKSF